MLIGTFAQVRSKRRPQGVIGSGAPGFLLDFTSSMPAGVTFTRASVAYAENAAGTTLTQFASNVPARTDKGILIEPAGTRLIGVPSTPEGMTVTTPSVTLPDGSTGACTLMTEDTSFGFHRVKQAGPPFVNGSVYGVSGFMLRSAGTRNIKSRAGTTAATAALIFSPVGAGTITAGTATFRALGAATWAKFEQVGTYASSGGFDEYDICHLTTTTITDDFFTGVATNATQMWAIQIEANKVTSPMPSGSRAACAMSFTAPNQSSLTYTFDDNSTQVVVCTPLATHTVPVGSLNRSYIKSIA